MASGKPDDILERVDPGKRGFVRKVIVGTAFVAPVVASFSMDGLTIADAHANGLSNQTES